MGNREDLMAGALKCILEKGYSRTTARDIATASGVSLAAIGYHFGSKDALLNEAMFQAVGSWGDELEKVFRHEEAEGRAPSYERRFESVWARLRDAFPSQQRLWLASFELVMQLDHIPGARQMFEQAMPMARSGLTALFLGVDEDEIDEKTARSSGAVYYSLMAGMLIQLFADPDHAPDGRELAKGLRAVAATLEAADG